MERIIQVTRVAATNVKEMTKIFWRGLWKGLKIFFTYGELKDDEKDRLENETSGDTQNHLIHEAKFNGSLSSLLLFVLLTNFTIIHFVASFKGLDNAQNSTKLILIVHMSLGGVIMIIFNRNKDRIFMNTRKKSLGVRGQLVLIGIIIFFILGSFLDLLYIIIISYCLPVYLKCNAKAIEDNFIALVFHGLRLSYLAGQTAFCTCYRGLKFKDKCLTRYSLMFLQAANLAIWFDIFLRQTTSKLKIHLKSYYYNECIGVAETEPNYLTTCIFFNGTYNSMIKDYGNNIIYPFLFQFSLLVLECYVQWFVQCGKVDSQENEDFTERDRTSSYCFTRNETSSRETMEIGNEKNYSGMVRKYFFIITFMNILFVLFNFLPMLGEEKRLFTLIASTYCTIYWSINTFLTFLGYYCSTAFKDNPKKKKFKSLNYLLVISAIGPYIYIFTALEAIVLTDDGLAEPKALTAIKELMFFLSVFCQIPFCFLVGRVVIPSRNHEHKFKVNCFKAITLHMAVSNCVQWIVNSFLSVFVIRNSTRIQTEYYAKLKWMFIDNIIQPLSVFFRFNSFLLFTAAYVRMTPMFSYKLQYVD